MNTVKKVGLFSCVISMSLLLQPLSYARYQNVAVKAADYALKGLMCTHGAVAAGSGGLIVSELYSSAKCNHPAGFGGSMAFVGMGTSFALWNGIACGALAFNRYYDFSKHPAYVKGAAQAFAVAVEALPLVVALGIKLKEEIDLQLAQQKRAKTV